MRIGVALVAMLLVPLPAEAEVRTTVTPQQLALAVNSADALLVPYRKAKLAPADVRHVRCIAPDEEPTEFECKWQQRTKAGWVSRKTWLASDGKGWHVMDA